MLLWIILAGLVIAVVTLNLYESKRRSKMTPEQIKQEDEQAADDNRKW